MGLIDRIFGKPPSPAIEEVHTAEISAPPRPVLRYIPSKELPLEAALIERRMVWINRPINGDFAERICLQMLYLQKQSRVAPVKLIVNSFGGAVGEGLKIYDVMRYLDVPVWTHCEGAAHGMASLIVAAGALGHRSATPHSTFSVCMLISADEHSNSVRRFEETRGHLPGIYARHSKLNKDDVVRELQHGLTFSALTAIDAGIIDRMIENPDCM